MSRLAQESGFAILELTLATIVLLGIAGVGYYTWQLHQSKPNGSITVSTTGSAASTSVPAAPQITSATDLNTAMQALDQTNIDAGNIDGGQLGTQAAAF